MGQLLKSAWGSPSMMLRLKTRTTMMSMSGREDAENPPVDGKENEPGEDDLDFEHDVQIVDDDLIPSRHWTCS